MRLPRRLAQGERAELVEHLDEFRSRVLVSLGAFVAAFALTYAFHERLIHLLNRALPREHAQPITLGIAEPFMTSFKISAYAAILLVLPVILWQFWSFVAPAVEQRTQRSVGALVVAAVGLLAAGLGFAYFVVLPAAVQFLTTYDSNLYDIQVRASAYYSFAVAVLLSVGIVFELPVFVLGLVRLGITSGARLRQSRRVGYAAVAVLAVVLPGVDPVTTAMEMIPLALLYEASIWLAVAFERRWHSEPEPAGAASF